MTTKTDDELSGGAQFALWLLAMIVRTPLDTWALWLFWGWFAVPLFGLTPLMFWQAYALDLCIGLVAIMCLRPPLKDVKSTDQSAWALVKAIPILVLIGIGWVIHQVAF